MARVHRAEMKKEVRVMNYPGYVRCCRQDLPPRC